MDWLAANRAIQPKPRDFNADFAEAVGTQQGFNEGLSPNEAVLRGIQARESTTDPLFQLKKLNFQTQIAGHVAQLADQARALQMRNDQIANEQLDKNALAQMAVESKGDPQKLIELGRQFVPQSSYGRLAATEIIRSATTSADYHDYIKRISALDPDSRTAIESIDDPVMRKQALRVAEQAMAQHKANTIAEAEINALQSGAQPTTTITEKGVSTTYRPTKPTEVTPYPEPVVKDIDGRPFLFYRNFSPKPMDRLNPKQQELVKISSAELRAARKTLSDAIDPQSKAEAQQRYNEAKTSFESLFPSESAATPSAPTAATPAAPVRTNEVIRVAPNGKRAVFDANTKQFLRYAD